MTDESDDCSGWTEQDEYDAIWAGYGPTEPLWSAQLFIQGVLESHPDVEGVVTPESRAAWGDFSGIRAAFEAIPDMGWGSFPAPAVGAPDVAYVKILGDVTHTHKLQADTLFWAPGVLTLVWRPERGFWMIHHYGDYLPPEEVPRTSACEAPDYTRPGWRFSLPDSRTGGRAREEHSDDKKVRNQ